MSVTGFNLMRRRQKEKQQEKKPELKFEELRQLAREKGVKGYGKMNKEELIEAVK